jgi:antitoxin component of MazEF toxin-antitoxin module
MAIETGRDGRIINSRSSRRFTLEDLLDGMTPEREHEADNDMPVGEETLRTKSTRGSRHCRFC